MNRRISIVLMAGMGASLAAALPLQAQTVTNVTGVVEATLAIQIGALTPVPQGDTVTCSVTITVTDAVGGGFSDSAQAPATLNSASSASCMVTIPYLWPLGFSAEDKVTVSYTVVVAPNGTTGTASPFTRSASGFDVASFAIPGNNKTTSLNFTTKI
jgi:hypothetical protein